MRFDLTKALQTAHLSLEETEETFLLKSHFSWNNETNFGAILVLVVGIIFLAIAWWIGTDSYMFFVPLAPGIVLFIGALIPIIAQFTNYLEINEKSITWRSNLVRNKLVIDPKLKLKYTSQALEASANAAAKGARFRIIDLLVIDKQKEYRMFSFQMDKGKAKVANQIGKELIKRMEKKIKA